MIPLFKQQIFHGLSKKAISLQDFGKVSPTKTRKTNKNYHISKVSTKNARRISKLRTKNKKRDNYISIFRNLKNVEKLTLKLEKNEQIEFDLAQNYKIMIKKLLATLELKRRKLNL